MKKKFNPLITVLLAVLLIVLSGFYSFAADETATDPSEPTSVVESTDSTYEETTESSSEETTTEAPTEEESTVHVHEFVTVVYPAEGYLDGSIINECFCGYKENKGTIPKVYSVEMDSHYANYDGTVKMPVVTIKTLNTTLTEGVDYDIEYPESMIEKGRYTIKILYKGNYKGEASLTFYIIHAENEVPELVSAESIKDGVLVKWNDIYKMFRDDSYSSSFVYMIYRKTPGGSWSKIASSVKGSEYLDKTAVYGETYYYTVKPYYTSEGEKHYGGYDKNGISVTVDFTVTPNAPKFEFKNTYGKVSWSAVNGATKYVLYRSSNPDSGYKKVYSGTKRYYNDKKIEPGNTYYYKLKAYLGSTASPASEYCSFTYKVAAPVLKKYLSVNGNAIKLSWNKIQGADGYAIYRKTKSDKTWKRIKTIKNFDILSYTDKNLNGTYYYKMIAYHTENGKNIYGSYSETAILKTIGKPETIKVATSKSTITTTLKWSKVSGAIKYEIYAKVSGTDWELIAETDASTRVYSHTVGLNTTFYYKVRAVYSYSTGSPYSVGPFSEYVKVKVDYLPDFSFSLPENTISDPKYITMKIKNKGVKTMRIYADGSTHLKPNENSYLNVETPLKMKKSTNGKYVDFIDVPAGKTVTIYLYPTEKLVLGYNSKDFIGFMFNYNSGTYVAALSEYYGSQVVFMG